MIVLLKRGSLEAKNRFRAERFSLSLSERQSTAVITIGPEAPQISVGDWLMDEDDPGAGIVWRVKSMDMVYETDTRTLNCEHLINSLKDRIMFGDVQPGKMAGNDKAKECTAKQAAQYVLKQQSDWTLGDFGYNKSAPYNFNGDDLFSALETISSSLFDAWWSYDFSSYPFKLSIKKKSSSNPCEMRMDRNIRTLKKTVDRTRMFTRFYPIGKNNLKIPGSYVGMNEKAYGVVCKVETDQNLDTVEKLTAWAEERLNNHAEPIVTVTVSGIDMSWATGESLDRLTLGRMCRMPLPEFDTEIDERITKLSWSDKIADPESVSITLANQVEDVASIINSLQKAGGGGGRAGAKNAEEDHAWFVDTTDHVAMVAEAVAGEGASKDWSRVAEIVVDGNGIHQRVTKTEGDMIDLQSDVEQTEDHWKATVEAIGEDGVIDAGTICLAINESGKPEATIKATKIYMLGETIANKINAEYISSQIAKMASVTAKRLHVTQSMDVDGGIRAGGYGYGNNNDLMDCFVQVSKEESGGNITLKFTRANGKTAGEVTFSRATSLSGEWSGNTWKVTASPQGNELSVIPQVHPVSSQGGNYVDVYVGTTSGSSWTNHGSATRLTLRKSGNYVQLVNNSGSVFAQIEI